MLLCKQQRQRLSRMSSDARPQGFNDFVSANSSQLATDVTNATLMGMLQVRLVRLLHWQILIQGPCHQPKRSPCPTTQRRYSRPFAAASIYFRNDTDEYIIESFVIRALNESSEAPGGFYTPDLIVRRFCLRKRRIQSATHVA